MALVAYSADGSLDLAGTASAYESAYGSVSDAVTRGQNKASILESLHVTGDAEGIAAAGIWALQNVPMPEVAEKVASVALQVEGGAAIGASVGALFGGVGAVFGAAVGAVISFFRSFLESAPPPPPKADSFDVLKQTVPYAEGGTVWAANGGSSGQDPLGTPLGSILNGQLMKIVWPPPLPDPTQGNWEFGGIMHLGEVAKALGGDPARAQKILSAYATYHPLVHYGLTGKFSLKWGAMMSADQQKNGGGPVPDLMKEAAIAALYSVIPDGKGHLWTARDWFQYLMLVRRGWEYTLKGQQSGLVPDSSYTPHWSALSAVAGYVSGLPGVVPTPEEQAATQAANLSSVLAAAAKANLVPHKTLSASRGNWERYYLRKGPIPGASVPIDYKES